MAKRSTSKTPTSKKKATKKKATKKKATKKKATKKKPKRGARAELEARLEAPTVDQYAVTELTPPPRKKKSEKPGVSGRKPRRSSSKKSKKKPAHTKKSSSNELESAEKQGKRRSSWRWIDRFFTSVLLGALTLSVIWVYGVNSWSQQHGARGLHPLSLKGLWVRSQTFVAYLHETWGPPAPKRPSLGYEKEIQAASLRYRVDTALIKGVIQAESGFRPLYVDSYGAIGLMQITPNIAKTLTPKKTWFRPSTNIMLGTYYLSRQLRKHRTRAHALAAYHFGMRGLSPPNRPQTLYYVKQVTKGVRLFERDPGQQIRRASKNPKPRRSRLKQMIKTIKAYF